MFVLGVILLVAGVLIALAIRRDIGLVMAVAGVILILVDVLAGADADAATMAVVGMVGRQSLGARS